MTSVKFQEIDVKKAELVSLLENGSLQTVPEIEQKATEIGVLFVELNYYLNWLCFELMMVKLLQNGENVHIDLMNYYMAYQYRMSFKGTRQERLKKEPEDVRRFANIIWSY